MIRWADFSWLSRDKPDVKAVSRDGHSRCIVLPTEQRISTIRIRWERSGCGPTSALEQARVTPRFPGVEAIGGRRFREPLRTTSLCRHGAGRKHQQCSHVGACPVKAILLLAGTMAGSGPGYGQLRPKQPAELESIRVCVEQSDEPDGPERPLHLVTAAVAPARISAISFPYFAMAAVKVEVDIPAVVGAGAIPSTRGTPLSSSAMHI